MSDTWIIVRDWNRLHHSGLVKPPMHVNVYASLLFDERWVALKPADRSALIGLWLAYLATGGRVRLNPTKISRLVGQRVTRLTLDRLNLAGFIVYSAGPEPFAPGPGPPMRPLEETPAA